MELIPEAGQAHKLVSMQAFAAAALVQVADITDVASAILTPETLALFPPQTAAIITLGLTILGGIGRLVKQPRV